MDGAAQISGGPLVTAWATGRPDYTANEHAWCENPRKRKRDSMSKIKFSDYEAKQSRMVEGVCVPIFGTVGDYDELLREAVRVALRMDMNPTRDDWDDLYDR